MKFLMSFAVIENKCSKELKCLFYTLTQHYSHIKYGDCAISFRNRPKKHTVEELLTLSEKLKSYIDQEN